MIEDAGECVNLIWELRGGSPFDIDKYLQKMQVLMENKVPFVWASGPLL